MGTNNIGLKLHNPITETLSEHLKTEWEIYSQRSELGYMSWIALALGNEDQQRDKHLQGISRTLSERLNALDASHFELDGNSTRSILLATKVLEGTSHSLSNSQREQVSEILGFVQSRNWFESLQMAGVVCYAAPNNVPANDHIRAAHTWILQKSEDALASKQDDIIADCLFGLAGIADSIAKLPDDDFASRLENHSLEKVAKALWFYGHLTKESATEVKNTLIQIVEKKVALKFHDWILPELQLSVFEGINLINTNLPPEEVARIMRQLRENGVSWAKQIEPEGGHLLISNLPQIGRLPRFNATEDALYYIALGKAGRQRVYQLTEPELGRAIRAIEMLGNDLKINPIQLRRAYLLGWLNIAFGFLLAILTIQNNLVPDLA